MAEVAEIFGEVAKQSPADGTERARIRRKAREEDERAAAAAKDRGGRKAPGPTPEPETTPRRGLTTENKKAPIRGPFSNRPSGHLDRSFDRKPR